MSNFRNKFNIKKQKKSRKKKKEDTTQSAETLKHSQSYSFLLEFYVHSAKISIIMKSLFKCIFFIIVMGILIGIVVIFWNIIKYVFTAYSSLKDINDISLETILSMITLILPAISSLIVAFIKIPEVIARYLFNIQEDDNMNKIIKDIQNYDRDMFALEHKVEEALMSGRTDDSNNEDDNIEEPPTASMGGRTDDSNNEDDNIEESPTASMGGRTDDSNNEDDNIEELPTVSMSGKIDDSDNEDDNMEEPPIASIN